VLVGVFSGLGFAAFENVQYGDMSVETSYALANEYGVSGLVGGVQSAMVVAMLRSVSLVFCHALWSGIVGYFLAVAAVSGKRWAALYLVGVGTAAVLHGLYNWLQEIQQTLAAGIVVISFVLFYAYLWKLRTLLPALATQKLGLPAGDGEAIISADT
jgi:RsiW-degrading membrane proteinase PrsW (M82 family)